MEAAKHKPHPKTSNQALTHYSATIGKPDHWMPEFVFRWYAVPNQANAAVFISVILLP